MSGIRIAALCLVLGACATAGPPGSDDDDDDDGGNNPTIDAPTVNPDGNNTPEIDAPILTIDGPPAPTTITLTQSSSMTITTANTVSCNNSSTGFTTENSYYRVFQLPSLGINAPFTVERIDFGVEEANAGAGTSQTVQANAYTLTGALNTANLTRIAGNVAAVNDQALGTVMVPMTPTGVAPAGSTLVIELFIPDGTAAGNIIFLGSNSSAETGPSYLRAPSCGASQPATIDSLVAGSTPPVPVVRMVMSVTGTY